VTRSARPRSTRWLLVAALVALVAGWVVSPAKVPLYDGVGFPDEPYRFVSPPAGYQHTPPPGSGQGTSPVSSGLNLQALYAQSPEQGPQVVVALAPGVLHTAGSATTMTVRAAPVAPDRNPPGGFIDGNVYRVTATTNTSGAVTYTAATGGASESGLTLRATSARQPGPIMIYRTTASAPWRRLRTARVGNDIYRSAFAGTGEYALAFGLTQPGGSDAKSGGGSFPVVWIVVIVLVVALGAIVVGIRLARRRAA
jgi:hypothetical protein